MFFKFTPKPFFGYRRYVLLIFGAKIAKTAKIYPKVKIWSPKNLICEPGATIADDVEIYNPAVVTVGENAIISQSAYICTATHDYNSPLFETIELPICFESYSWICAKAAVLPGVTVKQGAVLALASVAAKDLEPWTIYAGNPAKVIRKRIR